MPTYTDKKGYKRHSNLVHREKAYEQIYQKNRAKYPLPFSEYVVHHKDGDKQNNNIENLQLLTQEEHKIKHGIYDDLMNHNNPTFSCNGFEDYSPKGNLSNYYTEEDTRFNRPKEYIKPKSKRYTYLTIKSNLWNAFVFLVVSAFPFGIFAGIYIWEKNFTNLNIVLFLWLGIGMLIATHRTSIQTKVLGMVLVITLLGLISIFYV